MLVKILGSLTVAAVALAAAPMSHANPIVPSAGFSLSTLPACDDCAAGPVNLGFTADFFGNSYTSLYVDDNGIVTFGASYGSAYNPQTISTIPVPVIAPYYADVDTTAAGAVTYGTGLYDSQAAFMVDWTGVGYSTDENDKTDTFQLVIVDRPDLGAGDFDIYFNYGSMQWDVGDASGGSDGVCSLGSGIPPVAGYSNGSGSVVQIPGSGTCGALIDGGADALDTATNDGVTGQMMFEVINGVVTAAQNDPPGGDPVPEPSTAAILTAALAGMLYRRRRQVAYRAK
jgi:hypothetical protein